MYKNGIRAMYVLGEPEHFRPNIRATHLSPAYLSEEYIELLFYAFEKAKEKGMCVWLYNEGGFPSGSACGLVTEKYPELMYKNIAVSKLSLKKGDVYRARQKKCIAKPSNETKQRNNVKFKEEIRLIIANFFCFYCLHFEEPAPLGTNFATRRTLVRLRVTESKILPCFRSVCPICSIFRPPQKSCRKMKFILRQLFYLFTLC